MIPPFVVPDTLLARFRTVAFERLERIDAAWVELTHGTASQQTEQQMLRDLHTIKGDARVIGMAEVSLLCQRLEDLLFAARARRYRVHEDVDIVVTMAIQFVGMLLRKKAEAPRVGIDLEGFLKQIEEVIGDWLRKSSEAPGQAIPLGARPRLADLSTRMSAATRRTLSIAATAVYLEHLRAAGRARGRLRQVWDALAREVSELEAVEVGPLVERHAAAAADLAKELGKSIDVVTDTGDVRVGAEVFETLSTALLHTIRNAVDHGIESPEERVSRGKPPAGMIRIRGVYCEEGVELVVADDGAGVDLERVRARAMDKGLLGDAREFTDDQLVELLFRSGFSTRELVDTVSGRGIGMDALREGVLGLGGSVSLETVRGAGTTVTLSLPQPKNMMNVTTFRAAPGEPLLAIPAGWEVSEEAGEGPAIDPLAVLDLEELAGEPGEGAHRPHPVVRLRATRSSDMLLRGRGPVQKGMARRLCPTPSDSVAEVVEMEGVEALLLRPEVLLVTSSRAPLVRP